MNLKKRAFTLVELIVVISILAVLATIGYISYSGYISSARDTTRVHNISIISRAIEYHREKESLLFQPENMVPISLSGTVVGYQGDMGATSLGKIGITEGGTDPLDGEFYSYFLSGNKAQILTLLENPADTKIGNISPSTHAATDYSDRYPYFKGSALGIILQEDNTPIHRAPDVIAAGEFDVFNPAFSIRNVKSLYSNKNYTVMPALLIGGQLSLNSIKRTTDTCPENFIPVPGSQELGQPDFCIGKYEASAPGGNYKLTYNTIPGVIPVLNINYESYAGSLECRGNGPNYHIMTMREWVTVARNIEQVPLNWSNGKVGSGFIIGGNNGNTVTGFNAGEVLKTGPTGNTSQDNKRQLILSNGEIIWDFVGNAWEVVKPLNLFGINTPEFNEIILSLQPGTSYRNALNLYSVSGITSTNHYSWESVTDQNYKTMFGPVSGGSEKNGMGKFRQRSNLVSLVGGDFSDETGNENGLYSIFRNMSLNFANITTRCAYNY